MTSVTKTLSVSFDEKRKNLNKNSLRKIPNAKIFVENVINVEKRKMKVS